MKHTFEHYMNQYMNEELEHEGELWQQINPIMVAIQDFEKKYNLTTSPKESSNTVVVITWESGMVNVYRKDSKELLEVLIHEHHMIYEVMEAEMIP